MYRRCNRPLNRSKLVQRRTRRRWWSILDTIRDYKNKRRRDGRIERLCQGICRSQGLRQPVEGAEAKAGVSFKPITLAGWSAGCGAIRQIMRTPDYYDRVENTILINGIHTSYSGGKPGPLGPRESQEKKRVLITHSEIFPGTFASSTETADYILKELGLQRRPIVKWGTMQTQELSEVHQGRFLLIGFAGNSAGCRSYRYDA